MRTRRDFIDEQLARCRDEHLDAEHAAIVERGCDVRRELARSLGKRGRHARRRDRHIENAVTVMVLGDGPGRRFFALIAGDDYRYFARQ